MENTKEQPKVNYKGWDCFVQLKKYGNNRTAICLYDVEDGEPVATATVNLPEITLQDGYVHIKEWSENRGITECLEKAGIVMFMGLQIPVGPYGSYANLCKLLID